MAKQKVLTIEQAESRFKRAIDFTENVAGDPERAEEIETAGMDAWLDSKGYTLANPPTRRVNAMASQLPEDFRSLNKSDVVNEVLDAEDTLDAVWEEALVVDDSEYEKASDSEKIEMLEEAIENIIECCNSYDPERFAIDETDDDDDRDDLELEPADD